MKRSRAIWILSTVAVAAQINFTQAQQVYSLNIPGYANVQVTPVYATVQTRPSPATNIQTGACYGRTWYIGNSSNRVGFYVYGRRSGPQAYAALAIVRNQTVKGLRSMSSSCLGTLSFHPFRLSLSPVLLGIVGAVIAAGTLPFGALLARRMRRRADEARQQEEEGSSLPLNTGAATLVA